MSAGLRMPTLCSSANAAHARGWSRNIHRTCGPSFVELEGRTDGGRVTLFQDAAAKHLSDSLKRRALREFVAVVDECAHSGPLRLPAKFTIDARDGQSRMRGRPRACDKRHPLGAAGFTAASRRLGHDPRFDRIGADGQRTCTRGPRPGDVAEGPRQQRDNNQQGCAENHAEERRRARRLHVRPVGQPRCNPQDRKEQHEIDANVALVVAQDAAHDQILVVGVDHPQDGRDEHGHSRSLHARHQQDDGHHAGDEHEQAHRAAPIFAASCIRLPSPFARCFPWSQLPLVATPLAWVQLRQPPTRRCAQADAASPLLRSD